jgi:thioredoxin-related protein
MRWSDAMKLRALVMAVGVSIALSAACRPAWGAEGIAWQPAAADADIEHAFAQARAEHKPVLLYWGAKWCPPCNQLKATLFNRQDFIERSRGFVAVSLDGDQPGAQKLGSRFKVRGYPTMILFNTEGQEITRLPGEADAPQVMSVLQLGLANGRPAKAVLADARAGKPLQPNEWRLLAFYSWDTDEQQLVPQAERPALLSRLAASCPDAESAMRLQLKALSDADEAPTPKPDAAQRARVLALLDNPAASREQMDVLTNSAHDIVKAMAGNDKAERDALADRFDTALRRLQADTTLSRADRLDALLERVELARLRSGYADDAKQVKLATPLLQEVRDEAARQDREITDGYERQAVITTAAHVLHRAGLDAESDALLKANLAKSHSPYYLMSQLAGNAKARGDKAGALRWYREAYDKSEGPATRLQWGAAYVNALIELAPEDAPRIEQAVKQLWSEASSQPNAFYERSARSLQRVSAQLQKWGNGGHHAQEMQRLQSQMQGVCAKLDAADPQRATCESLAKPSQRKTA